MPPADRFDRLESGGHAALPAEIKDALSRLSRFQALEIGATPSATLSAAAKPPALPSPSQPPAVEKFPCVHSGQLNERDRETCWACYRFVRGKAPPPQSLRDPDDITLVLDGVTYTSSQERLPSDVAELFRRIRKQGYSQQLLVEWRAWRAANGGTLAPASAPRPAPSPVAPVPAPGESTGSDDALGIKVVRGQNASVIRLDGKVFTSDDPTLTPELKQLFAYLDAHGVTPALMEYLRQMGRVKLRPPTTAFPSDGDLAFWESVKKSHEERVGPAGFSAADAAVSERQAQYDLERAQQRVEATRARAIPAAIGLVLFALYIIVSIFLR